MKPEQTWFVATDAERMKVYTFVAAQDGSMRFVQIEERVHPESALKNSELVSSDHGHFKIMTTRPIGSGSSYGKGKSPGSKYQPKYEPHLLEAMHFAKEVADHLYTSHMRGKFKKLILCAADHFCGLVRQELKPALLKATFIERKGYTKTPIKKLEAIALGLLNTKPETKTKTKHINTAPAAAATKTKQPAKAKPRTKLGKAKAITSKAPTRVTKKLQPAK